MQANNLQVILSQLVDDVLEFETGGILLVPRLANHHFDGPLSELTGLGQRRKGVLFKRPSQTLKKKKHISFGQNGRAQHVQTR